MEIAYTEFFDGKPLEMVEVLLAHPDASLAQLIELAGLEAQDISDVFSLLPEANQEAFFKAWGECIRRRGQAKAEAFQLSLSHASRIIDAINAARDRGESVVLAEDIARQAMVSVAEVSQAFSLMHILAPSKIERDEYLPIRQLPDFDKIHRFFGLIRIPPEMYERGMYEGTLAETVTIQGANGDIINAYFARPLRAGPFPGMVMIHHALGWDEWYREATRRFAHHGYAAICPNLYDREGHGAPEDVAAKVRAAGGVPDDQVVGDAEGAMRYLRSLPHNSGKVGIFGTGSGGRHTVLVASRVQGFDAAVDCWGGRVVMAKEELTPKQPVAPIDLTQDLSCPLLGLFGNEDQAPTPAQVEQHEAELKKYGKTYEFYRYDKAGHDFFYYPRPAYQQEQAVDGWKKVFAFLEKHLVRHHS